MKNRICGRFIWSCFGCNRCQSRSSCLTVVLMWTFIISGTAFAEDLQARHMLALCKRAYTILTTHATTCVPTFHQFCDKLGEDMYNRVLHVLDMFGMEELTDFIRMTKPRETNKLVLDYTLSLRPPDTKPPTNILTTASSLGPLKQNSMAKSERCKAKPFKPMPAVRIQQMAAAGCPILHISSQIAKVRRGPRYRNTFLIHVACLYQLHKGQPL